MDELENAFDELGRRRRLLRLRVVEEQHVGALPALVRAAYRAADASGREDAAARGVQ